MATLSYALLVALTVIGGTMHGKQHPTVGEMAPDFVLLDQHEQPVRLYSLLKQSPVVLVFYPKDESTVCTKQWCSLRDMKATISTAGIMILGIAANSPQEHAAFAKHHHLPFTLLSDPHHSIAYLYGATFWGNIPRRSTIVISQDKMVLARYDNWKGLFDEKEHIDLIRKALAQSM